MRKAWIAGGLIVFMAVFCLVINNMVTAHIGEILDRLDEAEWQADHDDFEGAQAYVLSALELWGDKIPLFSMALPASRTFEVSTALQVIREQLACQDYDTYKASNALLVSELGILSEGYKVSWESVM